METEKRDYRTPKAMFKGEPQAAKQPSWTANLSVRAFAICLSVWLFTASVIVLKVPVFYPLIHEPELRLHDQFFAWRRFLSPHIDVRIPSSDGIVLVTIDDTSVRELGSYLPWPRVLYAQLLDRLKQTGASVVAMVMVFDKNPTHETPHVTERTSEIVHKASPGWTHDARGDDDKLRESIARYSGVVLSSSTDLKGRSGSSDPCSESFSHLTSVGSLMITPDDDGIVRRTRLVSDRLAAAGQLESSLGLRVLEKKLGATAVFSDGVVRVRDRRLPLTPGINYAGQDGSFTQVPFSRVLTGDIDPKLFKDRVVLVGFHQYRAPDGDLSPAYLTPSGHTRMSALEIQGHIINSLVKNRFITEPNPLEQSAILFLCSMLLAYLFYVFNGHPWSCLSGIAIMSIACVAWSFFCFIFLDYYVPSVVLILGLAFPSLVLVMADQNLLVFRERRKHTRLFHALVSPLQAQEIDRQKLSSLALEGKNMDVTLLLCEVDGLKELVKHLDAPEALKAVDEILRGMAEEVHDCQGMVWRADSCRLTGVWGAPLAVDEERRVALAMACASALRDSVYANFARLSAGVGLAWPSPSMRISVCEGVALCGKVGQDQFSSYAVVGDVVERASGYMRACQSLQVEFLIDERAARWVQDLGGEVRELDESDIEDSLNHKVRVFEYLGQKGRLSGVREESASLYTQAMAALRSGEPGKAEALLIQALRVWPEDAPALRLLEKCQRITRDPAGEAGSAIINNN